MYLRSTLGLLIWLRSFLILLYFFKFILILLFVRFKIGSFFFLFIIFSVLYFEIWRIMFLINWDWLAFAHRLFENVLNFFYSLLLANMSILKPLQNLCFKHLKFLRLIFLLLELLLLALYFFILHLLLLLKCKSLLFFNLFMSKLHLLLNPNAFILILLKHHFLYFVFHLFKLFFLILQCQYFLHFLWDDCSLFFIFLSSVYFFTTGNQLMLLIPVTFNLLLSLILFLIIHNFYFYHFLSTLSCFFYFL